MLTKFTECNIHYPNTIECGIKAISIILLTTMSFIILLFYIMYLIIRQCDRRHNINDDENIDSVFIY